MLSLSHTHTRREDHGTHNRTINIYKYLNLHTSFIEVTTTMFDPDSTCRDSKYFSVFWRSGQKALSLYTHKHRI